MGRHKGEMDRAAFEAALDELGQQGYELAWVFMDQALQREKDGHVLVFKRQIADAEIAASAQSPDAVATGSH
jgi:hypothetical protein